MGEGASSMLEGAERSRRLRGRVRGRGREVLRAAREHGAAHGREAVPLDRIRGRLGLPARVEGHGAADPARQAAGSAARPVIAPGEITMVERPGSEWTSSSSTPARRTTATTRGARARLAPTGPMAIDNTLWSGRVLDEGDDTETTRSIRELNDRIAADDRMVAVQLTVRDGVTLVRR